MSQPDLQRIEVLSKVVAGRMTILSAAHVLDLSTRQVRRLLDVFERHGAADLTSRIDLEQRGTAQCRSDRSVLSNSLQTICAVE